MSSTRIQCSWMFSRSVTSAVSRAKVWEISPIDAQLLGGQRPAVDAHPQHEVRRVELLLVDVPGVGAREALGALGVEPHPAETPAQVGRVDRVEAAVGVDVLDARPHVERVVVLLGLLVLVQRLAVAQRPLALGLALAGRGRAWASAACVLGGPGVTQRRGLRVRLLRGRGVLGRGGVSHGSGYPPGWCTGARGYDEVVLDEVVRGPAGVWWRCGRAQRARQRALAWRTRST